ncbi:MAG: TldD/PmbA family protein, partial [Oscillospiraceae bacterium]|nr:TldD/PmbA family protein [Oscillospiraceae bacterium]
MIKREVCERVLRRAASTGADFAELFRENTVNHSVHMIDSKVDAVTDAVVAGAGIRVFKGLRSVTASTVDTSEEGLMRCADAAAAALGEGTAQIDIVLTERLFGDIHPVKIVPSTVPNLRKIEILKEGYFAAKDYDPSITQVSGAIMD